MVLFDRLQGTRNSILGFNIVSKVVSLTPGNPATAKVNTRITDNSGKIIPFAVVTFLINGISEGFGYLDRNGTIDHIFNLPPQSGTYQLGVSLGITQYLRRFLGPPSTIQSISQNILTLDTVDGITGQRITVPITVTRKATGESGTVGPQGTIMIPYITPEEYTISVQPEIQATPQYPNGMGLAAADNVTTLSIFEDIKQLFTYLPFHLITIKNPYKAPYSLSAAPQVRLKKIGSDIFAALHMGLVQLVSTDVIMPPAENIVYSRGWITGGKEDDSLSVPVQALVDLQAEPIAFQWQAFPQLENDIADLEQLVPSTLFATSGSTVVISSGLPDVLLGLSKDYDMTFVDKIKPFILKYDLNYIGGLKCMQALAGKVRVDILDKVSGNILHTISNAAGVAISGSEDISQYIKNSSAITIMASVRSCIQHACGIVT